MNFRKIVDRKWNFKTKTSLTFLVLTLVNELELRLHRFLLKNFSINVKNNRSFITSKSASSIRTSFFFTYLERNLRSSFLNFLSSKINFYIFGNPQ